MSEDSTDEGTVSHTRDVVEGRAAPDPKLLAELVLLVRKHRSRIYNVCYGITRQPQLSDELTNDALVIALQKLPTFDGRSKLSTWVCGIAKFHTLNQVRKMGELLTEDGVVEPADEGSSVLKDLSRAERIAVVREVARSCLDAVEQEGVDLRYVENLPYEAIAGCMGLAGGSEDVRALLVRAKRKLRPAMRERLKQLDHSMSFIRTRDAADDR
jgi:RNA polymerase sigma-70 factor, ECF subfamily